jgi:hypothetical protein
MTEEQRITEALITAKETIVSLRLKLDLAIEALEEYSEHVVFDAFDWARETAVKTLEKIR